MHIPDGYLSPQTFIPLYGVMIPLWAVAVRKVRNTVRSSYLPLLSVGAAFTFVLMMFNIPVPGGTTGHAVGGALVAILLGPWAACIAVTLTLVIQALFFGDGGITALAANAFTMAVVMPFTAHYSYHLITGSAAPASSRRILAAFLSGYLALNVAALYTALFLGLQPLLASAPDGRPLYAPYPLALAVPAMAVQHLFLGVIEGAATALVIRYLQKADPALLSLRTQGQVSAAQALTKFRFGVAILALLSPLGIIVPRAFGVKSAWGEWSIEHLEQLVGFVPAGMHRLADVWRAPLADYAVAGVESGGVLVACVAYLLSAALGTAIVLGCVRICGRFLEHK